MRGCFLFLLLHTSPISGSTMTREPEWSGLEITDPIATRRPGRPLEDLENLIDRFPFHDDHNIGCSGCSDPKDGSSTTGISDQSTDGIGTSLPASCPTLFHCKRPSLKNRKKMVCCLLVERRGRYKCPISCD